MSLRKVVLDERAIPQVWYNLDVYKRQVPGRAPASGAKVKTYLRYWGELTSCGRWLCTRKCGSVKE